MALFISPLHRSFVPKCIQNPDFQSCPFCDLLLKMHDLRLVVPQSKAAKVAWIIVVCLGFLGAGYLISKSYSEWQSSPVSTSISTHSLKDLEFPSVAVCPPENSNTALNYDLLRAANYSFSKEDRKRLIDGIWDSFIAEDHRSFADEMLAAANPTALEQLYEGFQSVPTPYNHGYEVVVWNSSGAVSSAWYGEEYTNNAITDGGVAPPEILLT